jgi:hypothetical protein
LTAAAVYAAQIINVPRLMQKPLTVLGDTFWPLYVVHFQIMCILMHRACARLDVFARTQANGTPWVI